MKPITRRSCFKRIAYVLGAGALPFDIQRLSGMAAEPTIEPSPSDTEKARLANIAQDFLAATGAPGLSVAIARHGQLAFAEGFGVAEQATGEKVTPQHLFRICSVTKPITSAAVFLLVEQGKLKLDDFVFGRKGLLGADFSDIYHSFLEQITVHHLLTHTAGGWDNHENDPMFAHPQMKHHELIAWTLKNRPLENPPGTHYAYSNFGYCILGRILEKISGQRYEQFVGANILAKCGIRSMRLAGNRLAERTRNEVVYYAQKGEDPYGMNVRRMDSHGGWLATPTEIVKFATHVDGLNTSANILSQHTIKLMTTGTVVNPGYASGWLVNGVPNWWHDGNLPGSVSLVVRTASGLCWAAFANTRSRGMDLDGLMWRMAKAVPAWEA
jgi:CubicO group peptidase (beta-lactamase class C family)